MLIQKIITGEDSEIVIELSEDDNEKIIHTLVSIGEKEENTHGFYMTVKEAECLKSALDFIIHNVKNRD